jgi:hypothetical protein
MVAVTCGLLHLVVVTSAMMKGLRRARDEETRERTLRDPYLMLAATTGAVP